MCRLLIVSVCAFLLISSTAIATVPASITVQGRLTDSLGVPLPAGTKGFLFRIFNAPSGGTEIWSGEDQLLLTDADGLWAAQVGAIVGLNDAVFADTVRWLEIMVSGTTLPRVRLVTGPYAHRVSTIDGASGGTITTKVSIGPGHINTGLDAFVVGVDNEASGDNSTVGGGTVNGATGEAAVVSGGVNNWATGNYSTVGGGHSNSADGFFATVAGGGENSAAGEHSTVGGGSLNNASGLASAVVGGERNSARGDRAFVGAGGGPNIFDTNSALGGRSAIIAGSGNVVTGENALIGAGNSNSVAGGFGSHSSCIVAGQSNDVDALCASVVGGRNNKSRGPMSFVGGGGQPNAVPGDSNVASGIAAGIVCGIGNASSDSCTFVGAGRDNTASGKFAAVAGGLLNTAAGDYAFAAGRRAKSNHSGTFVWSDGTNADFASTAANQFLIRAAGGVGIGTTVPEAPLHVLESSAGAVTANSNSILALERSTGGWISFLTGETVQRGILFSEPVTGIAGGIVFDANSANDLSFRTGGNTTRMTLDATGNLNVTGNITATGTCCASDARFKRNIASIPNALEKVEHLRGVNYEWEREKFADRAFPEGQQVGLIAQEVREIVPQAVIEQSDGYLAVDYARLVPLLIESIKEQQRQIDELKKTIGSMTP